MKILVFNAGSSTHKCALFKELYLNQEPLWTGVLEWDRDKKKASLKVQANHTLVERDLNPLSVKEGVKSLLDLMTQGPVKVLESFDEIDAVGHRVVHGGELYTKPTEISSEVLQEIRKLSDLAPLHNPANVEGIELMEQLLPKASQVAVFDTAFHSHMPEFVKTYPGPLEWRCYGIKRYGFHGISHEYCAQAAAKLLGKDLESLSLVTCHLGNGSSLAAVKGGISINTTMGFTPLEGLMMGTRCGSIDPGIIFFLMHQRHLTSKEVERLLNYESGLLGISGGDSDMRSIIRRKQNGDEQAKLAFEMYVDRLKGSIASMTASLEGIDALVFTAGIGENSADVREACCKSLEFMGINIDLKLNLECRQDAIISNELSRVKVLVIKTREEWMIAKEVARVLI